MGAPGRDFYVPARNEIRLSEISVLPDSRFPTTPELSLFPSEIGGSIAADPLAHLARLTIGSNGRNLAQQAATFPILCNMLHIIKFSGVNEP